MDIEVAIRTLLLANAGVSALVGESIAPAQIQQQESYPAVYYNQAERQQMRCLASVVNLNRYTMHLEIEAVRHAEAKAIYTAVRKPVSEGGPLLGYAGTVGTAPDTIIIQDIWEVTGDDSALSPVHAGEDGVYRAGLDLLIYFAA